ncbi:MAG TPA: serine/threonine-protein kinase [Planctomycetota bacterium]|nr:serine/threonine-protein kinase [Planctomycetota bacterium]
MNLEELVEAHLRGEKLTVPNELEDFRLAIAAHEALLHALGETVVVPGEAPDARPPPELPDDYEIVRELGRGGMGVVYLVRQKSLGRLVALKVLRPGELMFGPLVKRFIEEARHLARLRHPSIVSIHEVGSAKEEPYFTMDYVEGEALSTTLAREQLLPSRALAILKQAAEGIQYAHEAGIIHRDLKPANILLDARGNAYVSDFGLARDMTRTSDLTRSGEVMGTPAYMSPEQAQGQTDLIGETTDVHALGAILYEMLAGRPPYGCDAPARVLIRLLREEPTPPRRIDRRIPRDLETVCLKAMAKLSEARYPTVRAFLEDLRRFESGQGILARRPGRIIRAVRYLRRRWQLASAIVLTGAVTAILSVLVTAKGPNDLLVEADALHSGGSHRGAMALYERALRWAPRHMSLAILERLIHCSAEAGDQAAGIEAALRMLELDPDAWFGELNYPVAMTLAARIPGRLPDGRKPEPGRPPDSSLLELAEKRLQIFLVGPYGGEAERAAARKALQEAAALLGREPFALSEADGWFTGLPSSPPAEILERARDESISAHERAGLAYAAAVGFERSGDPGAALAAYLTSFSILRAVHPVYFGLTDGTLEVSRRPRSLAHEPVECRRLRHLAWAIGRLDPTAPGVLHGGLRLRVTGLDLPPDLALNLQLSIWDPALEGTADGRRARSPLGQAPVQLDQSAWVGVADGAYRLAIKRGGSGASAQGSRGARASYLLEMLELDFSSLEAQGQVEIRGEPLELVIPARLLEEIQLLEPMGGERDLEDTVFRWSGLPGAAYYEIHLFKLEEIGGGVYANEARTYKLETSSARLGALPPTALTEASIPIAPGNRVSWEVRAFDGAGRTIGRSLKSAELLIAGKSGEEKK